jgi:hypothetical protein
LAKIALGRGKVIDYNLFISAAIQATWGKMAVGRATPSSAELGEELTKFAGTWFSFDQVPVFLAIS